ncbi:MAG: amidohydrolase [Betaproteobacteria bacterium]|nr:amidohydrolase [Betaproteobacteria bacterium]
MTDIDVHTHLAPIQPDRLASMPGVQWQAEAQVLVLDGHRVAVKDLFHPHRLVDWMDRHGVKRSWVSIPPPLYRQHLEVELASPWMQYVNDGLASIAEQSHGRLGALQYLPMEHPQLVQAWAEQPADPRFEGVAIAAGGHEGIVLSDPVYEPLWEVLNERKTFVFMHPGACADPRLARFYLENLVGNPYETGVAAAHLVMAGVPRRYPAIRFCLAHAGGIFASLVGRMERGFETTRPDVPQDQERPLQAARRFWVDGIAHHPSAMKLAQDVFGADHVLFGSDWPFPMGIPDPSRANAP